MITQPFGATTKKIIAWTAGIVVVVGLLAVVGVNTSASGWNSGIKRIEPENGFIKWLDENSDDSVSAICLRLTLTQPREIDLSTDRIVSATPLKYEIERTLIPVSREELSDVLNKAHSESRFGKYSLGHDVVTTREVIESMTRFEYDREASEFIHEQIDREETLGEVKEAVRKHHLQEYEVRRVMAETYEKLKRSNSAIEE